jgi:hypothetical protein
MIQSVFCHIGQNLFVWIVAPSGSPGGRCGVIISALAAPDYVFRELIPTGAFAYVQCHDYCSFLEFSCGLCRELLLHQPKMADFRVADHRETTFTPGHTQLQRLLRS